MDNLLPGLFGTEVFNDSVMQARLPREIYRALRHTIRDGRHLELDVANVVANAMKDWAVEMGCTHYSHWFQPMTGVTAEKHECFLNPDGSGHVIMEFSGKELVRGEPDASSFPSGGLRATFEARGYTAWDPTSYAFIKNGTLCIPTAFCSYSGEALDQKTPLLRSMDVLNAQALRILRLFGDTRTRHVSATVGPEQEYFLIDRALWLKRPDLRFCGRTLLGARPPKGQELDDHYFGALKPRVEAFMRDLDEALWKLGIMARTEHNEVAPSQHELASLYDTVNIAADHNQLVMELLQRVADRHGLVCLLHEKPFAGVNGSGKHNNWSIATDGGENLFDPGPAPSRNKRFLLFLTAVLQAVDEHQDLLRLSVASAGNDHRLGASEAPPSILSVFLGTELTEILDAVEEGVSHEDRHSASMQIGAQVLPHFMQDTTDRNRTSPFAFTGNKFEFRSPGSSFSVSFVNTVLNTILADTLRQFAEELEAADDFDAALDALLRRSIAAHRRIIFNGNNYADEWVAEAESRGLLNLPSAVDALPYLAHEENIALFERCGVLQRSEILARCEISLENYAKTLNIEALTMIDMVKKGVIPSVLAWEDRLLNILSKKQALSISLDAALETDQLQRVSALSACLAQRLEALEAAVTEARTPQDALASAQAFRRRVFPAMGALRIVCDELETIVGGDTWAYPGYGELLYSEG